MSVELGATLFCVFIGLFNVIFLTDDRGWALVALGLLTFMYKGYLDLKKKWKKPDPTNNPDANR